MPATYFLKKTIPANTLIEMEKDRYWVIEKIGTNIADRVTIEVDGIPVVDLHSTIAPVAKINTNLFGPIQLRDFYVVVPPERKLFARSATSGLVYLEGKLVVLSPGEPVLSEHIARYNAYATRKLSYYDYSFTVGASWAAGQEVTVASITPPTIEDHWLKRRAGVSVTGLSAALTYGQVAIKLYYDGKPLDQIAIGTRYHGIDAMKMPLPPSATVDFEPFSFEELPIQVVGGHTLEVKAVNVSGAALSAATGQNIVVRFMAVYERIIKG